GHGDPRRPQADRRLVHPATADALRPLSPDGRQPPRRRDHPPRPGVDAATDHYRGGLRRVAETRDRHPRRLPTAPPAAGAVASVPQSAGPESLTTKGEEIRREKVKGDARSV